MKKVKAQIILLILGMVVMIGLSVFALMSFYKDSKEEPPSEENNIIQDIEDEESIDKIIENQMKDDNILTSRFPILNKYSQNYTSVAQWMIDEIIKSMNENGYTVSIKENEEWIEVDGTTVYQDASEYMVELLNSDVDIEELFFFYCENLYNDLNDTFILGNEKNPEYSEALSVLLYEELIGYYEDLNFPKIMETVEDLITDFKFTMPYNYKICDIYQDAKAFEGYGTNMDAIKYGLNYTYLPETYFINYMRLSLEDKIVLTNDMNSLIPFKGTYIDIISSKEIDLKDYPKVEIFYASTIRNCKSVTRIEFKDRDFNKTYEAFIGNNFDNTKILLTIDILNAEKPIWKTAYEIQNKNNSVEEVITPTPTPIPTSIPQATPIPNEIDSTQISSDIMLPDEILKEMIDNNSEIIDDGNIDINTDENLESSEIETIN